MLAEKLSITLNTWEINPQKVLMVVTDNGSNMVKAVRRCEVVRHGVVGDDEVNDEEESENDTSDEERNGLSDEETDEDVEVMNLHRLPCMAHTLQLVLKEIDQVQSYKNLIAKSRNIVKSIRVSSVATEKLIQKCGKTVVTDCTTRWNSAYFMISRLLEIKTVVNEVLEEMKMDSLLFNEWARLVELSKILKPFKEQTDAMQTDTLSLSNIIPSLLELSLSLQDTSLTKVLSVPLLQSLRHRFCMFLDATSESFDPLPSAACLLDPTVTSVMSREDTAPLKNAAEAFIRKFVSILYYSAFEYLIVCHIRIILYLIIVNKLILLIVS